MFGVFHRNNEAPDELQSIQMKMQWPFFVIMGIVSVRLVQTLDWNHSKSSQKSFLCLNYTKYWQLVISVQFKSPPFPFKCRFTSTVPILLKFMLTYHHYWFMVCTTLRFLEKLFSHRVKKNKVLRRGRGDLIPTNSIGKNVETEKK